jgi:hypothetical protein
MGHKAMTEDRGEVSRMPLNQWVRITAVISFLIFVLSLIVCLIGVLRREPWIYALIDLFHAIDKFFGIDEPNADYWLRPLVMGIVYLLLLSIIAACAIVSVARLIKEGPISPRKNGPPPPR